MSQCCYSDMNDSVEGREHAQNLQTKAANLCSPVFFSHCDVLTRSLWGTRTLEVLFLCPSVYLKYESHYTFQYLCYLIFLLHSEGSIRVIVS